MKSYRFILRQFPLVLILYFQELLILLLVGLPVSRWLSSAANGNYFDYRMSIDFVIESIANRGGAPAFLSLLLLVLLLLFLLRIFLMAGVFESLLNHYPGFRRFLFDCTAHTRRFVLLFLIYGIPLVILMLIVSGVLSGFADDSPNQMMPVTMFIVGRVLVFLIAAIIGYWHTAARFRTIVEGRLRLAFRMKWGLFVRFLGYQLLAFLFGIVLAYLGFAWLFSAGTLPVTVALLLIQLGILIRISLKLASYKVLS